MGGNAVESTDAEQRINVWWEDTHIESPKELESKIKQLMLLSNIAPKYGFAHALAEISEHGVLVDAKEAKNMLARDTSNQEYCRGSGLAVRDTLGEIDDIWTHQFSIGKLNKIAIDYGDKLHLAKTTQQSSGEGDPQESNQCAIIALSAAIGRNAQNWKKRIPSKERVLLLATSVRDAELLTARSSMGALGKVTNLYDAEILTIIHDITHPHHPRDLRTIGFFASERRVGSQLYRHMHFRN